MMTRKRIDDMSTSTIYHRRPLGDSKIGKESLLIFVPGNPGLIDFYSVYLELLHEQFPSFEIYALAHAGFYQSNEDFKFYNMEYQIEHKYNFLKKLIKERENDIDLYFTAHSAGAYITQKLIQKLYNDQEINGKFHLKYVGLICPTICDIAMSHSGIFFTRLFKYLPIIQLALLLLWFLRLILSDNMAKYIIKTFLIEKPKLKDEKSLKGFDNSIEGAFKMYKSNQIVEQTLMLAKEEMVVILRDDTFQDWFFKKMPEENNVFIWSFFAEYDSWVHNDTRDYILEKYYDEKYKNLHFTLGHIDEKITHSFCIGQSVEFSQITINKLREIFKEL